MSAPLLQLREVGKNFGGVQAVRGLSFSVQRGQVLGLIGPAAAEPVTVRDAFGRSVTLPAGAKGTVDLTYRPPGLAVGLLGAGVGTLIGLGLAFVGWRSWRRRRPKEKPWTAPDRGPLEPREDVTTVSDVGPATP